MTRNLSNMRTALSLMVVLLLAACAQPEIPKDTFYRLDVGVPTPAPASPILPGVIEVERFAADGVLSGRPLVYSTNGAELLEYSYHFWTEVPTTLLQDQMIRYLRDANAARHVVPPRMRVQPEYQLTGKIKRLERLVGEASTVAVDLELELKRLSDDRILVVRSYKEILPSENSVAGAVVAINQALSAIYGQFLVDLGAAR